MALLTPAWIQPNTGDAEIDYTGQMDRSVIDVMCAQPGVTKKNDLLVSQRSLGANMSVDVAAGSCVIAGGSIAYQGKYVCLSTSSVNVPIVANTSGSTRTDLIVAKVYDKQADGGTLYSWTIEAIAGSTPLPPSYIPLASVAVANGASSIGTGVISDARLLNTLGDVPLWEVSGGNGFGIPSNSGTVYTGWSVSDSTGMRTLTTSGATVALPGRYSTAFSTRIDTDGSTNGVKQIDVSQYRGATLIARATSQVPHSGRSGGDPLSVATTFRCQAGDVVQAELYQSSTVTLHINDTYKETRFSGFWIGP